MYNQLCVVPIVCCCCLSGVMVGVGRFDSDTVRATQTLTVRHTQAHTQANDNTHTTQETRQDKDSVYSKPTLCVRSHTWSHPTVVPVGRVHSELPPVLRSTHHTVGRL